MGLFVTSRATPRRAPRAEALALMESVKRATGYELVGRVPGARDNDSREWSDPDVHRIAPLLMALPSQLRHLKTLTYLTREHHSAEDRAVADALSHRLGGGRGKIAAKGSLALSARFGDARPATREVRLYSELFNGSRVPGLRQMLAFTLIHELGHHQLWSDPGLSARWRAFFLSDGQREGPNGYARGSVDEGYGVGIGMYAVAPEWLRKRSPKTYEFFRREFGDSLAAYRGRGWESSAIRLTYAVRDLVAGRNDKR